MATDGHLDRTGVHLATTNQPDWRIDVLALTPPLEDFADGVTCRDPSTTKQNF